MSKGDKIQLGIIIGVGVAFVAAVIYRRDKFKPMKDWGKSDFSGTPVRGMREHEEGTFIKR